MSHQMVFGETGQGRASSAARSMSPLHMGRRRAGRLLTAGWLFSCFRTTPNIDDMVGNPLADRGSVWRYAGVWREKKERLCWGRGGAWTRTSAPSAGSQSRTATTTAGRLSAPMCGHKPARRGFTVYKRTFKAVTKRPLASLYEPNDGPEKCLCLIYLSNLLKRSTFTHFAFTDIDLHFSINIWGQNLTHSCAVRIEIQYYLGEVIKGSNGLHTHSLRTSSGA